MDIFSALAEPTRRDIIELLATRGQLPASDIYAEFDVSAPAISQHLKTLREAELVLVERQAQQRLYSVNIETLSQVDVWIKHINLIWYQRFNRLERVLKTHTERSS